MYKVLITSSGTGSRLMPITQSTNKSLLNIGDKKVIDYIISSYDPALELVITLGYYGNLVKEYILNNYLSRKILFVDIDKYEGQGSSLGYSMLQAKKLLQCPFIFHCNDTIIPNKIPSPELHNWDGVSRGNNSLLYNSNQYSSVTINEGIITSVKEKGALQYDSLHIGLVGIKDYSLFWQLLEHQYTSNPNDSTLNDCKVISEMIERNIIFYAKEFSNWYDTGRSEVLADSVKILANRFS